VRVGIDWLLEPVFPRDITKIELHRTETLKRAHFSQGEVIVLQGEIGDRFYIIQSGPIEVVQREGTNEEQRLAVLSVGESFGEIALLQNIPRNATVRCLTPVDVLVLSRKDFQSLVRGVNLFRDHLRKVPAVSQGDSELSKGGQATKMTDDFRAIQSLRSDQGFVI
jgi:NADH:ubiquinone reductase (H+-translocating)